MITTNHYHIWHGNSEPGRPVRKLTRLDRKFRTRQAAWQYSRGKWEFSIVLMCMHPNCYKD